MQKCIDSIDMHNEWIQNIIKKWNSLNNMEINRSNDYKVTGDSKEAIINLTRLKLETRKAKRKRGV